MYFRLFQKRKISKIFTKIFTIVFQLVNFNNIYFVEKNIHRILRTLYFMDRI